MICVHSDIWSGFDAVEPLSLAPSSHDVVQLFVVAWGERLATVLCAWGSVGGSLWIPQLHPGLWKTKFEGGAKLHGVITVGRNCFILWNCLCPPSKNVWADDILLVLRSALELCVDVSQNNKGMVVWNFLCGGCEVIPVFLPGLLVVFVVWCICSNECGGFVGCGKVKPEDAPVDRFYLCGDGCCFWVCY